MAFLWLLSPEVLAWCAPCWELTQVQLLLTNFFCSPAWASLEDSRHHRSAVGSMEGRGPAEFTDFSRSSVYEVMGSHVLLLFVLFCFWQKHLFSVISLEPNNLKLHTWYFISFVQSISGLTSSVRSLFPLLPQQEATSRLLHSTSCQNI